MRLSRRSLLIGSSAVALCRGSARSEGLGGEAAASGLTTLNTLRVGAGGYVTGMDISPDSKTKLIRTDVYGAYLWNSSSSSWDQVVTAQPMPAGTPSRRH